MRTVVIDIAEQKMKTQLLVSPKSKFKDSKIHIPSDIKILGGSGYQGTKDTHFNSRPPVKKQKKTS